MASVRRNGGRTKDGRTGKERRRLRDGKQLEEMEKGEQTDGKRDRLGRGKWGLRQKGQETEKKSKRL